MATAALMLAACGRTDDKAGILNELRQTDKLVLASMSITKTARLDNSSWLPGTKRIAVYSYDSYMRAYIDLSELQASDIVFDDKDRTVSITLPAVRTEVTGRDMNMRKEYDNIGPLRLPLDAKERAEIKEAANASFRAEVEENPEFRRRLADTARRKARKYFETLLEADGWTADIDFKPGRDD